MTVGDGSTGNDHDDNIPAAATASAESTANTNANDTTTQLAVDVNPKTLAPFNPSSQQIIDIALSKLNLQSTDVLFDIGCGDGRLLIEAVQRHDGLKCVGIEIDKVFVDRARESIDRILSEDAKSRIEIRHEDALAIQQQQQQQQIGHNTDLPSHLDNDISPTTADKTVSQLTLLDDATVLYLFVLPKGIVKLTPILIELVERRKGKRRIQDGKVWPPSLRILSYMFKLHDWEPTMVDRTAKGSLPIYYYEF